MDYLKPNLTEKFAKDLVSRLYGLQVLHIEKMVSFSDQNFHILVSQNHENPFIEDIIETGYTLKITNTKRSAMCGHHDSMHNIMFHVNRKGLRVPLPVRNLKGDTWSLEKVPLLNEEITDNDSTEPKYCGVHILTYISGLPIESIVETAEYTNNLYFEWGALLAKFHNATEDFKSPYLGNKSVFWSLKYVPNLKEYMIYLPEDKQKIVYKVLEKVSSDLIPNVHQLPKGIIHGDFNQNNVLVRKKLTESDTKILSVDGILDFEDIQEGTYVWDVSVMLAYCMVVYEGNDVLKAPGYALAGYFSLRQLNSLEKSLIKVCVESRLCQSLTLCSYSYQLDPSNTYILNSSRTGWEKLKSICSITNEDLYEKWQTIRSSVAEIE